MSKRKKRGAGETIPELALPERGVPRHLRVERELREEIAAALADLRDPRLNATTVTRVELTKDLSCARVWVRSALDRDDEPRQLVKGLERAGGRLRGQIGQALHLRKAPELRFIYDTGMDAAERVDELLAEIAAEDAERQ